MSANILDEINSIVHSSMFFKTFEQQHALDNMQSCRTIHRGGRILECPNCDKHLIIYHPCNQKGCPTCSRRNQILWKEKVQKNILPVSHYHLVFSIPQAFTVVWLRNKHKVINILFKCVSKVISEISNEYDILVGSVLVFQSHGKSMCYKPHIHCILSAGGLSEQNEWVEIGSLKYSHMEDEFRTLVYQEMLENISGEGLPDTKDIDVKEWRVHPEYHQGSGNNIVGYLSHTACGAVIDLNQSFIINDDTIQFTETHNKQKIETTLKKKTFAERYLNHIPPKGSVTVRYYGLYANQHKKEFKKILKKFPKQEVEMEKKALVEYCPDCKTQMNTILIFPPNADLTYYEMVCEHGPPLYKNLSIIK